MRGELDTLERTLMNALMVLTVHARDVVQLLKSINVNDINSFD